MEDMDRILMEAIKSLETEVVQLIVDNLLRTGGNQVMSDQLRNLREFYKGPALQLLNNTSDLLNDTLTAARGDIDAMENVVKRLSKHEQPLHRFLFSVLISYRDCEMFRKLMDRCYGKTAPPGLVADLRRRVVARLLGDLRQTCMRTLSDYAHENDAFTIVLQLLESNHPLDSIVAAVKSAESPGSSTKLGSGDKGLIMHMAWAYHRTDVVKEFLPDGDELHWEDLVLLMLEIFREYIRNAQEDFLRVIVRHIRGRGKQQWIDEQLSKRGEYEEQHRIYRNLHSVEHRLWWEGGKTSP
jgi:hypothetical protein